MGKQRDVGMILQVAVFIATLVGGYVSLNREIATLQAKVESLERNTQGMEIYIMDLYRQLK